MTSPEFFVDLRSYPRNTFLNHVFGAVPTAPGLYGQIWDGRLYITANNAAEIAQLAQQLSPPAVLALPAGGFPLRAALALGHLRRADLLNALASLPPREQPSRLILPAALAAAFNLGDSLGDISVETEPGFSPQTPALETVFAALRLLPGQMLLFTFPLLIFGFSAWLWGMAALLLSCFGIGTLWKFFPAPALVRGLALGLLLGGIFAALEPASLPQTWPRLMGLALAPLWYTLLMQGSRP